MNMVEPSGEPVTCPYKTVRGENILADVYCPIHGTAAKSTLIYIHGGCLMYGSRQGIHPAQLETYRNTGYTVISLDYRLAPETKLPEIIHGNQDTDVPYEQSVQMAEAFARHGVPHELVTMAGYGTASMQRGTIPPSSSLPAGFGFS